MPEYDWLIGNHSDELTPWIPVIAAKSSYRSSFLVIPCCPHDFDRKFIRSNTEQSQYSEYLEYVEKIGRACGFDVLTDRLKIPSTKRNCLLAFERTYNENESFDTFNKIDEFVNKRCFKYFGNDSNSVISKVNLDPAKSWITTFRPRAEERVRNCTTISQSIKEEIISLVTEFILRKKFMIEVIN